MNYAALVKSILSATNQLQGRAAASVNQALVIRNWMVGGWIVEFEQTGKDRAKYGTRLLETMAGDLSLAGVRGLTPTVLRSCRLVYQRYPQIRQTVSVELLEGIRGSGIRIAEPWKRAFFENECLKGNWSVRQLQRQIGSLLYERTGLSTNKKAVIERARKQAPQETIADLLRDPYILEFTGLSDLPAYSEDQLETALLNHLQRFLLELGRGFCFEARQFRMTEGRNHHRVDLVFYHRLLRCHVLIDLKIRAFQPVDAGQMNFYVNWFKANMMATGDAPPVGILLCSDKDGAEVEFATAGMDQKLFVSRYLTALPSAEKFRAFLEADRERIEKLMPEPPSAPKLPRRTKANKPEGGAA